MVISGPDLISYISAKQGIIQWKIPIVTKNLLCVEPGADTGWIPHFGVIRDPATGISPRRRLYPPACKPYGAEPGLEAEPEASIQLNYALSRNKVQ